MERQTDNVLADYNCNNVDKCDQLKSLYKLHRKSHNWYFFIFLMPVSYILHKLHADIIITQKNFHRQVVHDLKTEKLVCGKKKLNKTLHSTTTCMWNSKNVCKV